MRFKAMSDVFRRNAKRNYVLSLGIGLALVIVLIILFINIIKTPNYDPFSMIWLLIPYIVLSIPNGKFLVLSASQNNIVKIIGSNRYVTLNAKGLLLEDRKKNRDIHRFYSWNEFKHIYKSDITLFPKLNKKKAYTLIFVSDDKDFNYKIMSENIPKKRIEILDTFFIVIYNQDLAVEIEKYWDGKIEV